MWLQPNYFWMILKVKLLQSMISEAKSSCKGVGAGEKEKTIMWRVVKGHGGNNNKLLTAGYCTLQLKCGNKEEERGRRAWKMLFAFFQALLKLWNVLMRGQFICSSTLCFTTTSRAQHTGATTSTLSTRECVSAAERTGATHWATTSGRSGSRKVDVSFWKQELVCLSKVCGNTCYSVQINHRVWKWA